MRVLIAGISTRAAAESAARAGFAVTAIDAFADADQHPSVRAYSLERDLGATVTAHGAARASRTIAADAVAYLSNFENHPRAVSILAAGRALWGNPPEVLRRVRDPLLVANTLARSGAAVADVAPAAPTHAGRDQDAGRHSASGGSGGSAAARQWLVKPLKSGGGHRVRRWRAGSRVPRGCYRQEFIDGTPGSIVFAAAGGIAIPLGITRQLIGEPAFGAAGYRYCGSILAAAGDPQFPGEAALVDGAVALARATAGGFGLIGVNGVDFIVRGGVPYAIEVNPRWSASMELVERAYGVSVFGAHATACAAGSLPDFDLPRARRHAGATGKAVIFARRPVAVGDTRGWLDDPDVRDVPHAGERIRGGAPVCTVFAAAPDAARCYTALVRAADRVYAQLAIWERDAA